LAISNWQIISPNHYSLPVNEHVEIQEPLPIANCRLSIDTNWQ